ncbi:MAG: phage minor head protein [Pseudomonadota bacterium]
MPETHPSTVSGVLRKPFAEQVAFFRRKLGRLVPTARWDDLVRSEHDSAFMVAGAIKADLLSDLAAAVDRAIAEGKSLDAFRKDFRAIVARNGWHGWTGEDSKAGRAWRTRTIYRTNASTSYSAGRHAQLVAGNFAFWVYRHGNAKDPRIEHLGWDGLILEPGHIFWRTHYPPSAWGCTCYALGARSTRAAVRLGGDPAKQLGPGWDALDPKTGAPIGIGKNWNYAPGESVSPIVRAMAEKIRNWDYRIGKAFMEEVPEAQRDALARSYRKLPSVADDARRYAQRGWAGDLDMEPGRTLGLLTRDQVAAISLDAAGFDFSLSPNELAHIRASHGDPATEQKRGQRAVTPADFAALPAILGGTPRAIGISDGHKVPVFEIRATIGGEEYVTRWEYWKRRKTMTLLSFLIRTGKRA